MKNKHILIIFLLGTIITIFGSLLKILHLEIGVVTGNVVLTVGILVELLAVILFIFKLLKDNKNEFLNQ